MGLSAFYGSPKPDTERYAILDHIYNAGEHFWDTADMYGDSEDLLGRWFKKNPWQTGEYLSGHQVWKFCRPAYWQGLGEELARVYFTSY